MFLDHVTASAPQNFESNRNISHLSSGMNNNLFINLYSYHIL